MKIIEVLFGQKTATLRNGQTVKEGDAIKFIDSDKVERLCKVERRKFETIHCETGKILKKNTLFIINSGFNLEDYYSAELVN